MLENNPKTVVSNEDKVSILSTNTAVLHLLGEGGSEMPELLEGPLAAHSGSFLINPFLASNWKSEETKPGFN